MKNNMLKVYNTLTRKKEEFKPIEDKKVRFYQCGPTVYWIQHLGNMRAMVLADLIVRSLRYLGYEVKFVRNYTDVGHLVSDEDEGEDKMEKGARRENKTPQEIAEKYINIFENDIHDLNVIGPDVKPRATEHIPEIIEMVKILLDKGYAYSTDLAIYFDVSKAKDYTKLSGQILENNLAQAGKGEVEDPEKKNQVDFAIWFFKAGAHKHALQTWPSPFKSPLVENGQGFSGWHIECSAMSKKYLGETLDVHMGGMEHIPVHHTNEIAQSEAANGKKFVNYWLHNEHLNVNGGKMAKSEGTSYSLQDIKEKGFDPLVLRYFFLASHYRSKQNFTWEALEDAQRTLEKLRSKVLEFEEAENDKKLRNNLPAQGGETEKLGVGKRYKDKFILALEDDFNVPKALAILWEVVKDDDLRDKEKADLIFDFDKVFGLNLKNTERKEIPVPLEIQKLVNAREQARKKKNWEKSDNLREEISRSGFIVEDAKEGPIIKKK